MEASASQANQTFHFRGIPVRYARAGRGPAMLCFHNGGTSSTIWRHVASAFADRREVLAIDLPGYGASSQPTTGLPLADLIDLTLGFIDALGLAPLDLVGNCMGSAIALQVAAARPAAVRRLVLFNPLSEATFRGGRLKATGWLDRHAPATLDLANACLGRLALPAFLARAMLLTNFGAAGKRANLAADPALVACYTRPHQLSALRHLLADMERFGAIDRFTPGTGFPPRCTIWGEQNFILSATAGRRLNERLAPAREAWLADCGHLPMLERPETCIQLMTEFLDDQHFRPEARLPLTTTAPV